MGAEKGNQYYLNRSFDGRPKQFADPQELWDMFLEYKQYADDNPWIKQDVVRGGDSAGQPLEIPTQRPYTRKGFASFAGITERGLRNYGEEDSHKDFFQVYTRIMDIIDNQQLEGALVGCFNSNIVARVQGLTDKQQTDLTTKGDKISLTITPEDAKL